MNKKKSQITMLMIVGLVIFIAISLVLYLSKSAVKKQSQQNIKKAQEASIETLPVKGFVAECLDKLTKDAIVLLGRQGGNIYSSQGGITVDFSDADEGLFFVRHNSLNVAYNILQPKFALPPYSDAVPDYPWRTFPFQAASSNSEIFDGFFGVSRIPPLNSSDGPNSMQVQIESFIDKNIASCIDINAFKKQGIEVVAAPAKTHVTIGSRDVSIKSKIPITISNPRTNEIAELSDFSASVNVRLKDAYFFVKELIENDIKNIRFDINDIRNDKDGLSIRVASDALQNDDIIIVSDEKSLIYGKPFDYIFARKNRAPALHYIKQNAFQFPQDYEIRQEDLLPASGFKADDTDEDVISFKVFIGEFGDTIASFPKRLSLPQIKFRVVASDGRLSDYQVITVNRA